MPRSSRPASDTWPRRGTRIEIAVPSAATGGSTACTRSPPSRRTSTQGVASSMWRSPSPMSATASSRTSSSAARHSGAITAPLPRSTKSPGGAVDEHVGHLRVIEVHRQRVEGGMPGPRAVARLRAPAPRGRRRAGRAATPSTRGAGGSAARRSAASTAGCGARLDDEGIGHASTLGPAAHRSARSAPSGGQPMRARAWGGAESCRNERGRHPMGGMGCRHARHHTSGGDSGAAMPESNVRPLKSICDFMQWSKQMTRRRGVIYRSGPESARPLTIGGSECALRRVHCVSDSAGIPARDERVEAA